MGAFGKGIRDLTSKLGGKKPTPADSLATPLPKAKGALTGPTPAPKMVYGNPKARNAILSAAEAELNGQTNQAMKKKIAEQK